MYPKYSISVLLQPVTTFVSQISNLHGVTERQTDKPHIGQTNTRINRKTDRQIYTEEQKLQKDKSEKQTDTSARRDRKTDQTNHLIFIRLITKH